MPPRRTYLPGQLHLHDYRWRIFRNWGGEVLRNSGYVWIPLDEDTEQAFQMHTPPQSELWSVWDADVHVLGKYEIH